MRAGTDLRVAGQLPKSDESKAGASGGAMADTTMADLDRGFSLVDESKSGEKDPFMFTELEVVKGGFVGRPEGWER